MPDPKDNAKLTGDTHLPDVESDQPDQEGSDGDAQARQRSETGRPGRGVRKAGVVSEGGGPEVEADDGSGTDGAAGGDGGGDGGGGD